MKSRRLSWAVLSILASLALVSGAPAQIAPCTPGVTSYVGNGVITQVGAPYSATLVVTFDHRLGDGNLIHGVTRTLNARDSTGKARMETSMGCGRGDDGQPYTRLIVRIADASAGTFLDWNTGGPVRKVAKLLHQPEAFPKSAALPEPKNYEKVLKTPGQPTRILRSEALGARFIAGVLVLGERFTYTTPVGEQGNPLPIVETHERWMSRDLGIVMVDIVDDPVRGHTEMVLEDFSQSEPDGRLFLPPEGYTIEESTPSRCCR